MTQTELAAPPLLSTPAEHTFIEVDAIMIAASNQKRAERTNDELFEVYEIERTAAEIRDKSWKRVALQFPDAMLPDSPWVVEALNRELARLGPLPRESKGSNESIEGKGKATEEDGNELEMDYTQTAKEAEETSAANRFYILADTSYSACCVDEIAAEHADADAVVHYGRACLSPTSRLSVLHIFTKQTIDHEDVLHAFETEFCMNKGKQVIMADVMFQEHVVPVCELLHERGYRNVVATEVVRDPMGIIPNRKLLFSESQKARLEGQGDLKDYRMFHISTPPKSLLLTLSSRLASLHIYPTPSSPYATLSELIDPSATPALLQRRYGLVIRLATASIIGILVNTLSVQNYLPTITKLKEQIAAAGKKSYTIVVGKLNAAKLANFAEIDGWVVVGCWESGLVEQDGFWKPVVTPFELSLALAGDDKRVWDGSWWAGIEGVKTTDDAETEATEQEETSGQDPAEIGLETDHQEADGGVSDEESEPPEFDLRTGKLISRLVSRPMRVAPRTVPMMETPDQAGQTSTPKEGSSALVQRKATGEMAIVNGVASPGAQFLRSQRTWQGLGSDFNTKEDDEDEPNTVVEEGRSGIAREYTVGNDYSRA